MVDLTVPQTKTPTYFNKDALLGMGVGDLVGAPLAVAVGVGMAMAGISPALAVAAVVTTAVGTPLVGGIIGAITGKNRMEDEALHGKKVKTPSLLNKDAFAYGLGVPAIVGLAAAAAATFASPAIVGVLSVAALASYVGGAAYGAFSGKAEMQKDYDKAMGALQQRSQEQSTTIQKAQEILTGQEPQKNNGKSFVDAENERRSKGLVNQR